MKGKNMFNNKEPLYIQVANDIRMNIITQKWPAGFKLPTEKTLCEIYHVSRITVRRSIDELIRENLIERKKSKGAYVKTFTEPKYEFYTLVKSFNREMIEIGEKPITKVLDLDVVTADHEIANYLKIKPGEKVIRLNRLRGKKDKYFAYFETYLSYNAKLFESLINYEDSLYEKLKEHNINLVNNREIVEALLPVKSLCTLLNINKSTPILKRTRFCEDPVKDFNEYTKCYYIGTEYKYYVDFYKK
ncbi:GntR family transcriptional regulator [Helcococcus kunzii]|nr:GntR family transcriptional regulator [Helcococcus kunzii]QUY65432.1 GntR family transcriptional regulator [Helcococcus kunzii]